MFCNNAAIRNCNPPVSASPTLSYRPLQLLELLIEHMEAEWKPEDVHTMINAELPGSGFTALHHAVFSGNVDTVAYLIKHRAEVNKSSRTPVLHLAARCGDVDMVRLLLENNAQVIYRGQLVASCRPVTWKLLLGASNTYFVGIGVAVCLCVEPSASDTCVCPIQVDRKDDNGNTPLIYAVAQNHIEAAGLLLAAAEKLDAGLPMVVGTSNKYVLCQMCTATPTWIVRLAQCRDSRAFLQLCMLACSELHCMYAGCT